MKTDLAKILSISGQPGLFLYVAHARNGIIAEALSDHKRSCFGLTSKMTSLSDISIYTDEGEMKLAEVFTHLKDTLSGAEAPSSKSDAETLKALFLKAVPAYDGDRFYVSHMKKVVDWYNCLLKYASLDFVNPEEETEEAAAEEKKAE